MKFLIVIVIYNKTIEEIDYIKRLDAKDILVYDNSPNPQNVSSNIYYQHNKLNGGVSIAYNYGIELAKKLNKDFLILLDQDTNFNKSIYDTYKKNANKFGEDYIYAPIVKNGKRIYSPFLEGRFKNHPQDLTTFNFQKKYNMKGKSLINSGLMIPIKIFDKTGIFNEKIKLDFSDTFFIENYKKEYNEIILIETELEHKLSGDEGKNMQKEMKRFGYYCNGAKELEKSTSNTLRIKLLVFFRMIRLIFKYKTRIPISVYRKYYLGAVEV